MKITSACTFIFLLLLQFGCKKKGVAPVTEPYYPAKNITDGSTSWAYTYDAQNKLISKTTKSGSPVLTSVLNYTYDGDKVIKLQESPNSYWTLSYDASGKLQKQELMEGLLGVTRKFQFTYDANNRVSRVDETMANNANAYRSNVYSYKPNGLLDRIIFSEVYYPAARDTIRFEEYSEECNFDPWVAIDLVRSDIGYLHPSMLSGYKRLPIKISHTATDGFHGIYTYQLTLSGKKVEAIKLHTVRSDISNYNFDFNYKFGY